MIIQKRGLTTSLLDGPLIKLTYLFCDHWIVLTARFRRNNIMTHRVPLVNIFPLCKAFSVFGALVWLLPLSHNHQDPFIVAASELADLGSSEQ
jgi:hypothetical protein